MRLAIGIDIGTEGTKVVAVNEKGHVVCTSGRSYRFDVPRSGWTEQDPQVWWRAAVECLHELWQRGVSPKSVACIGVAGQMHSSVVLDTEGKVIRKSILWNDVRTKSICDDVMEQFGLGGYLSETCNALLPGFTLGKLLWMRYNEPQCYEQIAHVLMPKDYINFRLTGIISSDVTDASGTGVFDVRRRRWHDGLIAQLALPRHWFPDFAESGEVIGRVTSEAASDTGLPSGIPVIAGAADNAAAAVGMGILQTGQGLVSVGTSGVVLVALNRPPSPEEARAQNPTLHVFCHAIPGMWYAMGVTLSAGASLRWFRDAFENQADYDAVTRCVEDVQPGSDGLVYFPFLTGERTPYNSGALRGGFLGIHLAHSKAHFIRAVLEGVSYSLRECLDVITTIAPKPTSLTLAGGIAKSDRWIRILCDVLGVPLHVKLNAEGPAYGAALLAGKSQGMWHDLQTVSLGTDRLLEYLPNSVPAYIEGFARYRQYAQALLGTTEGQSLKAR